MNRPTISIDEEQDAGIEVGDADARRKRHHAEHEHAGHEEDHGRQIEHRPIGQFRHEILLEHQLHAVGNRLEQTVIANTVRSDP
jgi:hypothetical protein